MDRILIDQQLADGEEVVKKVLGEFGRKEETDPFAKEWNETLIQFTAAMHDLPDFPVLLDKLIDQFAFYEASPLNCHCNFFGLFNLIATAEQERVRHLESLNATRKTSDKREDALETQTLREMISLILGQSQTADQIREASLRLFGELSEFRIMNMIDQSNISFEDYLEERDTRQSDDERIRDRFGRTLH